MSENDQMSLMRGILLREDESPRTELRNGRNEVAGRGDAKYVG